MLLPPNHYKLYDSYRLPELYKINECYEYYVMNVRKKKLIEHLRNTECNLCSTTSIIIHHYVHYRYTTNSDGNQVKSS